MFWIVVLALITLERLGEWILAGGNTRRLQSAGAVEAGRRNHSLMFGLRSLWLIGLWPTAFGHTTNFAWLGVVIGLQALRVWAIASLGVRFTSRIMVLPGARLVRSGPYRFATHPYALLDVLEAAALPLSFGLYLYAGVFFVLTLLVTLVRVRDEDAALGRSAGREGWGQALASLGHVSLGEGAAPGFSAEPMDQLRTH